MTEQDVITYIVDTLGDIVSLVKLTDPAIVNAARLAKAAYGANYDAMTNELKWKILAEFFGLHVAVNYAMKLTKFTADDTSVDAAAIFQHVQDRWRNTLAMAQTYLSDAGITIVAPGAPLHPRNYGFRVGAMQTNYLEHSEVTEF